MEVLVVGEHVYGVMLPADSISQCSPSTPLEKRTQVWFEFQEEISFAHEFLMKMLPENRKIKKNLQRDV